MKLGHIRRAVAFIIASLLPLALEVVGLFGFWSSTLFLAAAKPIIASQPITEVVA